MHSKLLGDFSPAQGSASDIKERHSLQICVLGQAHAGPGSGVALLRSKKEKESCRNGGWTNSAVGCPSESRGALGPPILAGPEHKMVWLKKYRMGRLGVQ